MKQFSFGRQKSNGARSLPARRIRLGLASAVMMAATSGIVQAHPGHGLAEQGFEHLVASPYHLATLTGAGLALILGGRLFRRPATRRWMQLGGAASLMAAVIHWGMGA